ncbi:17-beta-hydroxysteroid dehydrogenase 14-like [Mercenaria mercenaria]|uniref:17-beta-hydroxysteroid dehydrogenase 14-like n=1 Tax=Mercenaria mercenaria TaxID=6596 RepID=UPI00234F3165|nr:17-beta-hydroxysteroid dehydrogenase 14-like [Mercenaria mercenaria]XP_053375935.1 17-beta-hydroxysteroid dehydrogenase 14-like [Mercenaria mercenaria]XP_053375936.1 17-beta-hydroxysteroid dehydrogenase 14-like [Mercenaria mercenaria]
MAEALRYKDKVTIVTGGSKGIGKGCVEVFVQHGSKVVFCSRGETEGRELETKMNAQGPGSALFVKCDMTKEDDIKNLISTTVEKYGQIDCVINNAGQHPPVLKIDEISGDDFRKLLDVNLVSYFLVAKYALPHLRKTKGCLIQDSSLVAEIGQPGACTYVATKGGVTSLTKALAIDEAEHGVRVNTFAPGNVWTPMWEEGAKLTPDYNQCVKAGEDSQLLGRMGTIEECGKACLFLAADATFCTGINILMSGGAELCYGIKNPKAKASGSFL